MTVFLFVTAAVALLAGLMGLVARHVPRTTGRQEDEGASRAEGHAPSNAHDGKPRHDFLDACAALTRPCLVNINSTSTHAVLRHDAPSTYGKPSIHIQGLTVIQHGRLHAAPM